MCRSGKCWECRLQAAAKRAEETHGWRLPEYHEVMSTRTIAIAAFIIAVILLILWI
jgi:hypothetical protein